MDGRAALMCSANGIRSAALVTTSWDDGHPLDIRLAEMLARYGVLGTFYIPVHYRHAPVVTREEIRTLCAMGMEIGSHTLTHPHLTMLTKGQALHELVASKHRLEDIVGEAVESFSYPEGQFNSVARSWVVEAGYRLARTTSAFRIDSEFDPFYMPVSFQFFPHSRVTTTRHAIREGNMVGLINWCQLWKMKRDPVQLVALGLEHILEHGGLLHIWGHSWEIEQHYLWGALEDALKHIANRREVVYMTNAQVLALENPDAARDLA
jgi:peptidoglycan/xylan/chitin deacetylase (PgdA/CDA1 family)